MTLVTRKRSRGLIGSRTLVEEEATRIFAEMCKINLSPMGPGDVSSSTSVVTVVTKRTAVVVAAVVVVVVTVVGSCVVGEGDSGAAAVVAAAVGITSGMQSPASSQLTSSPSPCTHQCKSLSRHIQ
jgi:hypothetical protein